jgi:5-amino-6-(5-phosphoribosylamino)uracil reductase
MRPRVVCNFAPSLDGKIAPARKRAPFVMSRHREDKRRMLSLRVRSDAVVIGASNLRADDPDLLPSRLRVVVTRAGDHVEPTAKMFDPSAGGEAVVAHAATMPESKRSSLRARATLVELGAEEVDLTGLLEWLARERGCKLVVCEGGGVLSAGLFAARAIDELYVTVVPRILGGALAPTLVEGRGFEPDDIPDGRILSVERVGDELFLGYAFDWTK